MLTATALGGRSRTIRMDLKCSPGNKPCGERCIPQEYECGGDQGSSSAPRSTSAAPAAPSQPSLPSAGTMIGAGTALATLGFVGLQNREAIVQGLQRALKPQKLTRQQIRSNARSKALGEFVNSGARAAINTLKIGFGGPVGKIFGIKGLIDNGRQFGRAAKQVGSVEAEMVNRSLTAKLLMEKRRKGQLSGAQRSEYLRRKGEGFNVSQRKELAGVESSITTATRQTREKAQQVGEAYGNLRERGRKAETAAQTAAFNITNNFNEAVRKGREREAALKKRFGNWFGLSKQDSLLDLVCWDSLNPVFQEQILAGWRSPV